MANYLGKFVCNFSEVTAPLRTLLQDTTEFRWDEWLHGKAFEELKDLLKNLPVLQFFDVKKKTILQVDSSQNALGGVLLQDSKPIAFVSRALTETEQAYAQIEKEMLAICFGAERLHTYLYGLKNGFIVQSDHKPLLSIFKKSLAVAPRRLQRMLLRLQRYDFQVQFKPGSEIIVADALSRAAPPLNDNDRTESVFTEEVAHMSDASTGRLNYIVASELVQDLIKSAAKSDPLYTALKAQIISGWPEHKRDLSCDLKPFHTFCDEIAVDDECLFKGDRLFVPISIRQRC